VLQKHVTKSLELGPGGFEFKLKRGQRMLEEYFARSPRPRAAFTALELGTGWYPTISVALFLYGAKKVWTLDIAPLLRPENVRVILRYFSEYHERGALAGLLPRLQPQRVATVRKILNSDGLSAADMLARLNIEVLVRDARQSSLPAGSADLICSESVGEHVPKEVLADILKELRRLSSPGAVMIHSIDLSDHYRSFDPRIGPFNMLRYSARAWRWLDTPLAPHNRMRVSDYRELHRACGFDIVAEENNSGKRADLDRIRVHKQFKRYSTADLLVTYSWIVSVPSAASKPRSGPAGAEISKHITSD